MKPPNSSILSLSNVLCSLSSSYEMQAVAKDWFVYSLDDLVLGEIVH